jgi:hypothetical protein
MVGGDALGGVSAPRPSDARWSRAQSGEKEFLA